MMIANIFGALFLLLCVASVIFAMYCLKTMAHGVGGMVARMDNLEKKLDEIKSKLEEIKQK